MNKKIRWITETAVMLALLVSLQALTKPMGQLVTGSCVNAILAVSALVGGLSCGLSFCFSSSGRPSYRRMLADSGAGNRYR